MRNGKGRFPEAPEPETKQKRRSDHSMQKKASARPTVWECREKTLQENPFFRLELRVFTIGSKGPKEGLRFLLSGDLQLDNSSLQPDRDSMSPVFSAKLREYVRNVAFHACFAD